jgi:hypothetical protein
MSTIRPLKKREAPKVTKETKPKRPKTTPEATGTAPTEPPHIPSKTVIRFSGPPPIFSIDVYTHPTATKLFGQVKVSFQSLENI